MVQEERRMTRRSAEKSETRKRAERIAHNLFVNGAGQLATRLVMVDESGDEPRDLGGWCEEAVADKIESVLEQA